MRFKTEDIAGLIINGEEVHYECATDEGIAETKSEEAITIEDAEESDELIYCSRCEKPLFGIDFGVW